MPNTTTLQMQVRRDTAANWATNDPVLAEGEIGLETDTNWHKIGNGTDVFSDLLYYHGPPWLQGIDGGSPGSTFTGAPTSSFHGVMAYAEFVTPASASYTFADITWYDMGCISTDPLTGNILVAGRRQVGDANGTLMIYNRSDDTFTNYATIPFTDPSSIAMTDSGRVYVLKSSDNASQYDCYYSDAPYSTWTLTTHTSTASHGNRIVVWDEVGEKMFWGTGAAFLTADENGTDFPSRQQYTSNGGPSVFNVGLVSFWRRYTLGGQSQWICGSTALTGSSERTYRSLATSAATTPIDAGEVDNVDDLFIGINGGPVIDIFKSPTEDKIFALGQNGGIAASTNGTTWTDQVDTSLTTDIVTHYHGYTIPAFNKMYISGRDALAETVIWESTDGATWTKSTDTRITAYTWKASGNRVPTHWTHLNNEGLAFIHVDGTNQDQMIYMK